MLRTSAVKKFQIEFGEKTRTLSYPFRAYAKFKEATDAELFKVLSSALAEPAEIPSSHLVALVWSGLVEDDPDLSLDDVGGWLDLNIFFNQLLPVIGEAVLGKKLDEVEEDRPTNPSPTENSDS